MQTRTGGQTVVEALRREGVTHVFGLIGSATMEIFDALYDATDITYVGVRHEACAVHMADAYGRMTGRAGVVLAGQNGPGAANMTTGLAQALLAYSPVVAIAGAVTTSHADKDGFQEIDQQALFPAVTKKTLTVRQTARLPYYMTEAFRVAESGRKGPVVVNIPRDLLAMEVDADTRTPTRQLAGPAAPGAEGLDRAAALLRGSVRPLIVAGAGVKWSRSSQDVIALAEHLQAPIAASAGHPDVVPNDLPLFAGQIGPRGNAVATRLALEADVILALGTRLGFNSTFFSHDNISSTAQLIQVDIDPSAIGRYFPVEVAIAADAGETARSLLATIDTPARVRPWITDFQDERRRLLQTRSVEAETQTPTMSPQRAFAAIQKVMPRNAVITLDAGTCCLQATDVLQTFQPPAFITPLDFGLVGFSFAAGIGAKAAAPDRTVISLMGDGGFGMTLGEIGTAIQAGLNTITVVLNNGVWGAEKAYQRDFYGERYLGADVVNPQFDVVAKAFGANGVRVDNGDDLSQAIDEALGIDKPTVIDAAIDPNAIVSFRRDSFTHRPAQLAR